MLRLLQDDFKNNFRTTKNNFTLLGTAQPQLVLSENIAGGSHQISNYSRIKKVDLVQGGWDGQEYCYLLVGGSGVRSHVYVTLNSTFG